MTAVDPTPANRRAGQAPAAETDITDDDAWAVASAWCEYRNDYGVSTAVMDAAHKAFRAGWAAASRGGDPEPGGALR